MLKFPNILMRQVVIGVLVAAFGPVAILILGRQMSNAPEWIWRAVSLLCVAAGVTIALLSNPVYSRWRGENYTHAGSTLIVALACAIFGGAGWWFLGQSSPTSGASAPAQAQDGSTLPPLLREDMNLFQTPVLRELIRQIGVEEMWLSQVMERGRGGGLDGIPARGTVDYPSALKNLAKNGEVEILEIRQQQYQDFSGEVFSENIHFRIKKLPPPPSKPTLVIR